MLTQVSEFAANHPMLVIAFATLLSLVVFNEVKSATQRFVSLTPAAAVQLMNTEDVVIVDLREPAETVGGKITKAVQIPFSAMTQRVSELEKYKEKTVLLYDKTGARTASVCKTLTKNGFNKVFSLSGGIVAWQEAHMPLSKK